MEYRIAMRAVLAAWAALSLCWLSATASAQVFPVQQKLLPSFGDGFPDLSVDYCGLLKLADVSPSAKYAKEYRALMTDGSGGFVDDLLSEIDNAPDDPWYYLLLVHGAAKADRLGEITALLQTKSRRSFNKKPRSTLHLGAFYAKAFYANRKSSEEQSFGVMSARLRELKIPEDRISIMMWLSALWVYELPGAVRVPADDYLKSDPGFYQLRTLYAHSLAYGAGPITNPDGSTVKGSAFASNSNLLQHHIRIVINAHPNYAPAYFVAVAGAKRQDAIKYIRYFMENSDPACGWHKRAKAGLERLLKG